jgi:hypothetical protein
MTINKECKRCKKSFTVENKRADTAKFCSRICQIMSRSKRGTVICKKCGKEFWNTVSNGVDRKYCSVTCYRISIIKKFGSDNASFKNGNQAYRRIARERHIKMCIICHTEQTLEVHHVNGIGKDHRSENMIMICRKCHKLTHSGKTCFSQFLPTFSRVKDNVF